MTIEYSALPSRSPRFPRALLRQLLPPLFLIFANPLDLTAVVSYRRTHIAFGLGRFCLRNFGLSLKNTLDGGPPPDLPFLDLWSLRQIVGHPRVWPPEVSLSLVIIASPLQAFGKLDDLAESPRDGFYICEKGSLPVKLRIRFRLNVVLSLLRRFHRSERRRWMRYQRFSQLRKRSLLAAAFRMVLDVTWNDILLISSDWHRKHRA